MKYKSVEYWKCAARILIASFGDYMGGCKLGTDATAVVGPDLRVIGFEGLRVADACIIPRPVSGHLITTVVLIAEKAAEIIKEERLK